MSGKRIRRPSGICCPSATQLPQTTQMKIHCLRENIKAFLKECCRAKIDIFGKKREIVTASERRTHWWGLKISCCSWTDSRDKRKQYCASTRTTATMKATGDRAG